MHQLKKTQTYLQNYYYICLMLDALDFIKIIKCSDDTDIQQLFDTQQNHMIVYEKNCVPVVVASSISHLHTHRLAPIYICVR